ncbi:MAG: DNA polymerase I [Trueperaceae bacterium]|nr:DNA polymerase I [Trueperaceae bacterium]MCO5174827.1 DNA polymerase I [Trueperaceae bacterium]MCW5818621.1 DNA polymerase I [Trueperaceae bacterium]
MSAKKRADPLQPSLFGADVGPDAPAAEGAGTGGGRAPGRPRLVLVDGHGLAYRAYFAIRQLSTSAGMPTNAVYGFMRAILDLLRAQEPADGLIVAFDAPAPTFRKARYAEYKAHRPKAPDDFPLQLNAIRSLLDLIGVQRVETPGLEADDLIGSLAVRAARAGWLVEIVTSDRDAMQLVSDDVTVVSPDGKQRMDPAAVVDKYGVTPAQWVDYRALTGDSSDNIPGVKGIGPIAARKLLELYGDLDALLANLGSLPSKAQATAISEGLEALELSRELSRIVTDAEVALQVVPAGERRMQRQELTAALQQLEFGSLLFELGLSERTAYERAPWDEVAADLDVDAGVEAHWAYGYLLSDVRPTAARVTDLALAAAGRVAEAQAGAGVAERVAGLGVVNAADAKALVVASRLAGAEAVAGDDPLLMAYLLDSAGASAETLARRLGVGEWGVGARDHAAVSAELVKALGSRLQGRQREVYERIERPLQDVLADMEVAGILLDLPLLADMSAEAAAELAVLEARLGAIAGTGGFNVASRDQVAWLLFEKLGLRAGHRTATGKQSTAVGAIEPLRGQHEAVDLILEHREVAKLKGTYLDPLPALADGEGRVHTTFEQAVVATGRLSSVNPNLQNVPVRTARGREVRRAFIAGEGRTLLVADYSQIELRMLAHIAEEPALIEAFMTGEDIHRSTAANVYAVEPDAVTSDMRRVAKVINFGVLYGMSAQRLSRELEIAYDRAEAFIATYFQRYPRVRAYIDGTLASARATGYVETIMGRRRAVPDLLSPNRSVREGAERVAYNMPIQGSAADVMKLAMLELAPALAGFGGRLLLQVHDEVVAEVPSERAREAAAVVRDIMAGVIDLKVPLVADVGLGANWLDAK